AFCGRGGATGARPVPGYPTKRTPPYEPIQPQPDRSSHIIGIRSAVRRRAADECDAARPPRAIRRRGPSALVPGSIYCSSIPAKRRTLSTGRNERRARSFLHGCSEPSAALATRAFATERLPLGCETR